MTLSQGYCTLLGYTQKLCKISTRSNKGIKNYGPGQIFNIKQTYGQTDRQCDFYIPHELCLRAIQMTVQQWGPVTVHVLTSLTLFTF